MTLATLAIALVALVALAMIFVGRGPHPSPSRTVLLMVMATLGLLLGFRAATDALELYPETWGLRLAKNVEGQLRRAAQDPEVERILLIEGSSYSARGIDGAMLARLLSRRSGGKTAVVQLTLDGANHFERSWLLDKAMDSLSDEELAALRKKHLTLLMEIQQGYDLAPIHGFMRNRGSDRTYAYMTLENAWDSLRAMRLLGPAAAENFEDVAPVVVSHAAVNALGVGLAHRMARFDTVKPLGGFLPLRKRRRGFDFGNGMSEILQLARAKRAAPPRVETPTPAWIEEIRLQRYIDRLPGMVDQQAYYAVPSMDAEDLIYVEAFCASRPRAICISYGDPGLIKRLNRPVDWSDARHMRAAGAQKFTRWFSKRYSRETEKAVAK